MTGARSDPRRRRPCATTAAAGSRPTSSDRPRRRRRRAPTPRARTRCPERRRSRPGGRAAGATDARATARPPASRANARTSGAQLETLDLAGRRLRQLADELDPARIFIGRDLVLDEGLQLVGEAGAAARGLLEHDERLGLHEPIGVLVDDDGRLEHGRVPDQRVLDLHRRYPDAADLQHVVGAARVPEVAVGILPVLVARLDPWAVERLLRLLVLVPVVGHRRVALDAQVADLALRDRPALVVHDDRLVARHRLPGGARA